MVLLIEAEIDAGPQANRVGRIVADLHVLQMLHQQPPEAARIGLVAERLTEEPFRGLDSFGNIMRKSPGLRRLARAESADQEVG